MASRKPYPPNSIVTMDEGAQLIGVSPSTLYRWLSKVAVKKYRHAYNVYYLLKDIERLHWLMIEDPEGITSFKSKLVQSDRRKEMLANKVPLTNSVYRNMGSVKEQRKRPLTYKKKTKKENHECVLDCGSS